MAKPTAEATQRRKPNYVYSIVSVALVLFLIGFFGLLVLHARQLLNTFKERISVMVELQDSVATAQMDSLGAYLRDSRFVKKGTVQFVSREEAAQLMREDFGDDFLKLGLPNPFYDVFLFNLKAEYMEADSLIQLRTQLRAQYPFVGDVFYQENVVDSVAGNMRRLAYVALALGIFLILVAIALIYNTVRLALYANRFLIKNMELVGASWEFISRPYLVRAVVHGALSGALAVVALVLLLLWARTRLPDLRALQDLAGFSTLFAGLLILGILINTGSTYLVVRKYLQMRVDDLY
ncbi:MAG TPA: permease-like cell division protein FtsX [Saprospiraceae bacterium]|nr:permease-like cell division protein FtsX [Saprospiraceae bacterium]HMP24938.1 permease-like cell division protein FtsX [Saprospiraceae bacterium]